MTDHINTFRSLFQIDVAKYVEMKGQFSYLSWPFAVAQLGWLTRRRTGRCGALTGCPTCPPNSASSSRWR